MDEPDRLAFLSVLGEEVCAALSPVVGWDAVIPQDGYEVFYLTFGQEPNPKRLASLAEADFEQLRVNSEAYFECEDITIAHVRTFVTGTLARWPLGAD